VFSGRRYLTVGPIGVFAASGRSAWAVGCTRFFADPKAKPVVLHWNGTAWK
jgi:hypothetical protein